MQRHDLLRVDPVVWQGMLNGRPDLADLPLVGDWASRRWPVIVRRRMAGDAADGVSAALPLPPCFGKQRVGFSFASMAGIVPVPPVRLRDAAAAAPGSWRPTLTALMALAADGAGPCVFGSLLWQHLTGQPYVRESSDLDLLWPVADVRAAIVLVAALRRLEVGSPVRLDGELILPDGGGVNWRELAQGEEVMVKTMHGVEVRPLAGLFAPAILAP